MDTIFIDRIKKNNGYERNHGAPPVGSQKFSDTPGERCTDHVFLVQKAKMLRKIAWLYSSHSDTLLEVEGFEVSI